MAKKKITEPMNQILITRTENARPDSTYLHN